LVDRSGVCSFYFFCQAEDGIRDRNVTGVQTCALPISIISLVEPTSILTFTLGKSLKYFARISGRIVYPIKDDTPIEIFPSIAPRSEERRVGKECISWLAQE